MWRTSEVFIYPGIWMVALIKSSDQMLSNGIRVLFILRANVWTGYGGEKAYRCV